jgi:hypothetical protein
MTIGFGHGYASIFVTTLRLPGAVNAVSAYDVTRDVACDVAVRCFVLVVPHGPIIICHVASELWSQIWFTIVNKYSIIWSHKIRINHVNHIIAIDISKTT